MIRIDSILGSRVDPVLHGRIHALEHAGALAMVTVAPEDLDRRRLRASTDDGEEVAIALSRDQKLFDGAVLLLEKDRAVVVRAGVQRWLRISPRNVGDALELGYHCGNLHWRVRFQGADVLIALNAPVEDYLARLGPILADERISWREEAE